MSFAFEMIDLLVSSVTPVLDSGTGLRTYGVVAALARRRRVHVAYVVFDAAAPAREYDALSSVAIRPLRASRGPRRAAAYLRARARGVPAALARGVSPELVHAASTASPDARLIADGPVVAAALLPLAQSRNVVYLAHNLESGFRTDWGRGDLRRFERRVLRCFSECWMPTRADVRGALALGGPRVNAVHVPNVVDVAKIRPARPAGTGRLVFVGDFTYEPNREGLEYLVENVLPRLWARRPAARLDVVGRGPVELPGDTRIAVRGFVEDLEAVYGSADAVVVPLLHGGGSPLKFIEGLAYGLPVVATEHAARLLEDGVPGRDFLAAATPEAFAAALDLTLGDAGRAAALGAAGRELATRCYSIDALATILAA
jgi:glycosyltransferase involved in cell wall biosynthesis